MTISSHALILAKDSTNHGYSLLQVCKQCCTEPEFVISVVNHEILNPIGNLPIRWRFDANQLALLQTILLLNRRYNMNLPGIRYVLNLLETNRALRTRLLMIESSM